MLVKCDKCGHQHEHPDPEPPVRAMRWCVWDTRSYEPYEGYKIWETMMEKEKDCETWVIYPHTRYSSRFDRSFTTRQEAYAYVLDELNEELSEKNLEISKMIAQRDRED